MNKLVAKPVAIGISVASGTAAGLILKRVWKVTPGHEDAPDAADFRFGWKELLAAAAIQGALTGVIKAALQRSVAHRPDPGEAGAAG